jgi:hypothetical protein
MLIYCKHITPRLQYIFDFVWKQQLGVEYSITIDKDFFIAWREEKFAYTHEVFEEGLQIIATDLLFETDIEEQVIDSVVVHDIHCPFATHKGILPFDVFAAAFYLITRYEEYLPHSKNKYGQYIATQSLAYKNNFLQKPVINIWIQWLKIALQKVYPNLVFKQNSFTATITYDIDTAYAYKGRSAILSFAGLSRDLLKGKWNAVKNRIQVLLGKRKDDYDTYGHILNVSKQYGYKPILFFLVGERNAYNKNINPSTKVFKQLIATLKTNTHFGIHPSYYTPNDVDLAKEEKAILQNLVEQKITISRQHYLRLVLPQTYKNCAALGITDDYTMGYAEQPGFRASTCSAFYFFDIAQNKITNLKVHPITFMEGTFAEDMAMQPQAAQEYMLQLLQQVKNVQGEFIGIWHNHTISDMGLWKGWKAVHDAVIKQVHSNG